ncbi:Translational activator GCN1 [Operophtera brumata]|uniref:Translational activator GCN1 n=1 Tax=Operophtera brumata TaxID=104452 RepID=A0A0L7LJF3_OPEBR|nr:Translational activator GCN1 [Operophtera brumata]
MAAARTFDSLHATIGNKALDDILPAMLDMLSDPDPAIADAALDGLKQPTRHAAAALLCAYVSHTRADLSPHVPQLLRGLLLLLAETERDVLMMAWEALQVFTKALEPEQLIAHVSDVRGALRHVSADLKGELLPGFCLPKGIAPILPLFRESILNGLPEDKENAALMLGEVIKLTSAAALQPSVVHVTGPLIRILGDRFNASVKAAVLDTLASLLAKASSNNNITYKTLVIDLFCLLQVGVMLKQFLPQLQTTFLKALLDANRPVRLRAGTALAQLVLIHTRADPLFQDVHNGIKSADEQAIRETCVQALRHVITAGGDKMSGPLALSILATLSGPALLAHSDDALRGADAAIQHHVLGSSDDWLLQHGRSCALFIEKALQSYLASDKIPVVCNGIRGMGYLIRHLLTNARGVPSNLLSQFVRVSDALLASDKIPVVCNGIRGMGYLIRHLLTNGRGVPSNLLSQFVRVSDALLASDKIPVVCNGIRGMGYLIRHLLTNGRGVPSNLLSQFVRALLASDKIPVVCNGIRGMGYLIRHLLTNGRGVPSNLLSQFVRVSVTRCSPATRSPECATESEAWAT